MIDRVALNLDERNDVRFDVKITTSEKFGGTDGPDVSLRFICEADELEFAFRGSSMSDGSIQVIVPPMKGLMPEGVYDALLEVIVEGRHFVPLKLEAEFSEPLKVVAEGVRVVGSSRRDASGPVDVVAAVRKVASAKRRVVRELKTSKRARKRPRVTSDAALKKMDELMKGLG